MVRSWFNKICNNIPECYYLAEHISASQPSVLPNSVGLHHLFRVKRRLRWCIQDPGHPSSPNMAGVRTTSLPDPAPLAAGGPAAKGWDPLWLTVKGSQERRAARTLCRAALAARGVAEHHQGEGQGQGWPGAVGQQGSGEAAPHLAQPHQLRARCDRPSRGCRGMGFSTNRQEQRKQSTEFHLNYHTRYKKKRFHFKGVWLILG